MNSKSIASPVRVLLVDDHFMIRMGLASALEREKGITVVAQAGDGDEAVAAYAKDLPDVVVMDGRLPDRHGSVVTREILERWPDARVLMLSIEETEEDIHRAVDAGACGYISKTIARALIVEAIRTVAAGGQYFSDALAAKLFERRRRKSVSTRELEVLRLIATGRSNKEIAADLGLSEATVKTHVAHLMEKLDAPDRTRVIIAALERGLIKVG